MNLRFNFPASILSSILLLFFINAKAQYYEKEYGNNIHTNGVYFSPTSDHGIVILGNSLDSVLHTSGYYILKTDSDGNALWQNNFVDGFSAYGYSITSLKDGKIVFLGTHAGLTYQNIAEVVVLDTNGSFVNSAVYPPFNGWGTAGVGMTSFGDSAVSITLYNDGFISNNYYSIFTLNPDLSTNWSDFVGFDGSFTNAHGIVDGPGQNIFTIAYYDNYFYSATALFRVTHVRKHDSSGNVLIDSLYEFNCVTTAVSSTKDGGAVICAIQDSSFQRDMILIRLDSAGNVLWQKQYGGFFDEESNSVVQTSDSGFALLATIADPVVPGQHDLLLMKLNSNGDSLWARKFGGILDEKGLHISEDKNDLILMGSTTSFGSDQVYIVRTDSSGVIQSQYNIISNGRYYCPGDTGILQLSPAPPAGFHITWSNGDTINPVRVLNSGNYFATITDSTGHSFQTPISPVYFTAPPNADFGPDTISLCSGSYLIDTAISELTNTYQWYFNGTPIPGENLSYYAPQRNGNYKLIVRNFCSSDSSTSYVDTLFPLPVQPNITSQIVDYVCPGDSAALSVIPQNGETYQWYSADDFNSYIIPGATDTIYYIHDTGIFLVEATNINGCTMLSSPYPVSYDYDQEVVTPNGPSNFCEGGNILLSVSPGTNFLWSRGDTTQSIIVDSTGNYFVSFINQYGCPKNSDSLSVIVFPNPVVYLGDDTNLCSGASILLNAGSGYSNYRWNTGSNNQTITVSAVGLLPDTSDIYVFVTDTNGCTTSDSIRIVFDICAGIVGEEFRSIQIYPNPSSTDQIIHFDYPNNESATMVISDILNCEIIRQNFRGAFIIDAGNFRPGTYLYSIYNDKNHLISGKLIIQ